MQWVVEIWDVREQSRFEARYTAPSPDAARELAADEYKGTFRRRGIRLRCYVIKGVFRGSF